MTWTTKILLVVALAAGGASGFAAYQVAGKIESQQKQIAGLQKEIADLQDRLVAEQPREEADGTAIDRLRVDVAPATADAPASLLLPLHAETEELTATQSRVLDDLAALVSQRLDRVNAAQTSLELPKDDIRLALEEIREEEEQDRRARREERELERTRNRVARYAEELNLSTNQEEQLVETYLTTMQKRNELFEINREDGVGRRGMREQMDTLRKEEDEAVQALLTPSQYEALKKLQEEERPQWGRGGFGGARRGFTPATGGSGDTPTQGESTPQPGTRTRP